MSLKEESMSSFKMYLDCKKQWYYRYKRGLVPLRDSQDAKPMNIGTLFHAGCAGGYRSLMSKKMDWLTAAKGEVQAVLNDGYDWHGEKQQVDLEPEDVQLVQDMLAFYWNNKGKHDKFDEILAVEESIPLFIAGKLVYCTFDLVAKVDGHIQVWDHKTVGSVKESKAFLPFDTQANMYAISAWLKYGEPVEFVHNFVRRAVPKELTATGRKSTASKDPEDYLLRTTMLKTTRELEYLLGEYTALGEEMQSRTWFPREPNKSFTGCSSCPYAGVCSNEQTGRISPDGMLQLDYKIEVPS